MIWLVVVTTIAVAQWKEVTVDAVWKEAMADAIPGFGSLFFYSFVADAAMTMAAVPVFPLVMVAIAAALSLFSFFFAAAVTASKN